MTPDIIKAIADLLATNEACHEKADDGYVQTADPEWQKMADAGDALSVALGIGADTTWRETADAFRALARQDVGLPEGWTAANSVVFVGGVSYPAHGPPGNYVVLHVYGSGKTCWGQSGYATPAVYAHLLRAAGVAS